MIINWIDVLICIPICLCVCIPTCITVCTRICRLEDKKRHEKDT